MSFLSPAVGQLPPLTVGTLAVDDDAGTVVQLGSSEPLTPPLSNGQGVAALVLHPHLPVAYGLTMGPEGRVFCWRTADRGWEVLADLPSYGTVPCHLAVDPEGAFLAVTNYGTGTLTVYPLDTTGRPGAPSWLQTLAGEGPHPERQRHSHTHHVTFLDAKLLLVTDLGGDAVVSFHLDRRCGRLYPAQVSPMPPGSGPRHLVVLPNDQVAISGELDNTVILGRIDRSSGSITVTAVAPSSWRTDLRDDAAESLASDITTDGTVVYVANRGYNTVATLRIGANTLTAIDEVHSRGEWPQHLCLSGPLLLVACQRSDQVTIWSRSADGSLTFADSVSVPRPAWLTMITN